MTRVFRPLSAKSTPQLAADVVLPDIVMCPALCSFSITFRFEMDRRDNEILVDAVRSNKS